MMMNISFLGREIWVESTDERSKGLITSRKSVLNIENETDSTTFFTTNPESFFVQLKISTCALFVGPVGIHDPSVRARYKCPSPPNLQLPYHFADRAIISWGLSHFQCPLLLSGELSTFPLIFFRQVICAQIENCDSV
jgi:hypothetical protein